VLVQKYVSKACLLVYTTRPNLFARRADAPVQDANAGRPVRTGCGRSSDNQFKLQLKYRNAIQYVNITTLQLIFDNTDKKTLLSLLEPETSTSCKIQNETQSFHSR